MRVATTDGKTHVMGIHVDPHHAAAVVAQVKQLQPYKPWELARAAAGKSECVCVCAHVCVCARCACVPLLGCQLRAWGCRCSSGKGRHGNMGKLLSHAAANRTGEARCVGLPFCT